jgi:Rps23 Pro-64 3,4-dihydroxylase Tpa1-like proline 4-hydroxylase
MVGNPAMLNELFSPSYLKNLSELAEARQSEYRNASPFPHIVMDNFLPAAVAAKAVSEFPDLQADVNWYTKKAKTSSKSSSPHIDKFPPTLRDIFLFFNSGPALRFFETLTGIDNLISDPKLQGGGLHRIDNGGFLEVHADFNVYEAYKLDRRLNALIYLNPGWQESWGGRLELWDKQMTHAVQSIAPILNRCVVFSTTSDSYHGHPLPLTFPPGVARQSLALYYYTNGRPESERTGAHNTLYQQRPTA